jgi:hypothetical protein
VLDPMQDSIPAGYEVAAAAPRSLQLAAGASAQVDLVIPANRIIAGTIRGASTASGPATVRIVELDRSAAIDGDGRYVFRGLPPGSYTVEATVSGHAMRHVIELPAGPAAIHDVDFP